MKKYPPSINCKRALEIMGLFLEKHLKNAKKEKFVLGLSGGVDSSVVAGVVCETIGKEKLVAVKMPYKTSNPQSEKDADLVIKKYKLNSYRVDISNIVDSYFEENHFLTEDTSNPFFRVRKGNFAARARMAILFDISARENGLVLGTGNRSEILLGYTTWYGDSASSLNPIGNLYKAQVYQLAKHLGIPENIVSKAPSADLWANQTDEGDMGIKYKDADAVLYLIYDAKKNPSEVSRILKISTGMIEKIIQRVKNNQFKRKLPPIAKIF